MTDSTDSPEPTEPDESTEDPTAAADVAVGTITNDGGMATVRFEWSFDAPPPRLWTMLTTPEELAKWLAQATVDLRDGGAVELVWPEQGAMRGAIDEFDDGHTIGMTWTESSGTSHVRFTLEGAGDGTVLTLEHRDTTPTDAVGFGAGWQGHLESLEDVLDGFDSTPEDRDERFLTLQPLYLALAQEQFSDLHPATAPEPDAPKRRWRLFGRHDDDDEVDDPLVEHHDAHEVDGVTTTDEPETP